MRIEGNRKNHELSRKLGCEITRGCDMKRRRCSAIFVGNLRRQTPLHRQNGVQIRTLQRYEDYKEHEDAVSEEAYMRDTFSNTQSRVFRAESQAILTAMRAVYWLAKEDIATVKYDSLLNFLDEVGLESVRIFEKEEMLPIDLLKVLKVCKMLLLLF